MGITPLASPQQMLQLTCNAQEAISNNGTCVIDTSQSVSRVCLLQAQRATRLSLLAVTQLIPHCMHIPNHL